MYGNNYLSYIYEDTTITQLLVNRFEKRIRGCRQCQTVCQFPSAK